MANFVFQVLGLLNGVAGTVLGVIDLLSNPTLTPDPLSEGNSLVRIGIGLNSTRLSGIDMGGTIPSIQVYNENRQPIGSKGSYEQDKIGEGQYRTITINQNVSSQQPTYLELAAGADEVCIAYLGQTWSDGTKVGWLGDMGRFCGMRWFYSNLFVQQTNGTMYKPVCTWLGGPANWTIDGKPPLRGFRIHTPDFGRVGTSNDFQVPSNPQSLCSAPKSEWFARIPFRSAAPTVKPFAFLNMAAMIGGAFSYVVERSPRLPRRDLINRSPSDQKAIIGSHSVEHNATALCADPNSYGPDFVSFSERVFCNMETKKTVPLCSEAVKENCYDWDDHTLVGRGLRKRARQYTNVIEWNS